MLITNLQPIQSGLSKLKEIPDTFFGNLEDAIIFDNNLFPDWLTNNVGFPVVFGNRTELRNKFKAIYEKYKAIDNLVERQKIIIAYTDTNKIIELCNNNDGITCYELNDLHKSIRKEIDEAFLYLYKDALNHPVFENFVNDKVSDALKRFTDDNGIEVCPFCGLEMILQLTGQPRLPLDHWLNKDRFPFASINFSNLIPIGSYCNSNGVKGSKNVLRDISLRPPQKAFYPYSVHKGVNILISCIELPNIDNEFGVWSFSINPNDEMERDIFESWKHIFNISVRFESYFNDILIRNWKKQYINFIKDEDDDIEIVHAQTTDEFKENLKQWKRIFKIKNRHASLIYQKFIDYLVQDAPQELLVGIVENFKSQVNAGVI